MNRRAPGRVGAVAGIVAVAGNVAGVAVLGPIPSAYRPDEIAAWSLQVLDAPVAAAVSGISFTLGLIALAIWAAISAWRTSHVAAWVGGALAAIGASLNAAGTLAPLVSAYLLGPACGRSDGCLAAVGALLGTSLALDACFNLLLGIGLVLLGSARWQGGGPRWLAALQVIAGIACIPVSGQVFSPRAADLLLAAGPLWLGAITADALQLWRSRP
jgi:hypothetical protein